MTDIERIAIKAQIEVLDELLDRYHANDDSIIKYTINKKEELEIKLKRDDKFD